MAKYRATHCSISTAVAPDELRDAAVGAGYKVHPTAAHDGLVLETTIPVDAASFEAQSQRMQAWADEFDSDYDGWECQMVNQ